MALLIAAAVTMAAIPAAPLTEGQRAHAAVARGGDCFRLLDLRGAALGPNGEYAQAIQTCGGHSRLTLYFDPGQWSWERAYLDPALTLWLIGQRGQHPIIKDSK